MNFPAASTGVLKGSLIFPYTASGREPSLRASQPLKLYANAVGEANMTRRSPRILEGINSALNFQFTSFLKI